MFEKYDEKTRRRIFSLFSNVIDTNVKLGITNSMKITDNFIKDITHKNMETWKSLQIYVDSTYFYENCIMYANEKVSEYQERYGDISDKGRLTDGQITYLKNLIERALKHNEYKIRMAALNELGHILQMLSKSSGSHFIDRYKEILGYDKRE